MKSPANNDSNFLDLLNLSLLFSQEKNDDKGLKSYVRHGLKSLVEFPFVLNAFIFLYDENEYEFKLFDKFPESENADALFNRLMDSGTVSQALQTAEISYHKEHGDIFSVIPLKNIRGINSLLVLKIDENPESMKLYHLKLLANFGHIFSSGLSEVLLNDEIKQTKEILDQVVASRTMELEKSKQSLGDKIDYLTSSLIMTIPHEIRTPINQINGMTELLKTFCRDTDNPNAEEIREILNDISDSTGRLRRLFENYIYYSNLVVLSHDIKEMRRLKEQVTYSAESVIRDTVLNQADHFGRTGDITINAVDSPLLVSEEHFTKAVEEIIDNALKYSSSGSPVTISSRIEGQQYILKIRDEGIGITEEHAENIGTYMQFEREKIEQQGIGLGMAIILKIVSLAGGEFRITGHKDEYTEVTLKFNLARVEL